MKKKKANIIVAIGIIMILIAGFLYLYVESTRNVIEEKTPIEELSSPYTNTTEEKTAEENMTEEKTAEENMTEEKTAEENMTEENTVEENMTEENTIEKNTTEKNTTEETNYNKEETELKLTIGNTTLTATLANNSSAEALVELLKTGSITINMDDYASMEKVGSLGTNLPRNDEQITTEAGDLILYQGSAFVIYYAPNSWNFTRLGKINNVTAKELKEILGSGSVAVTLSIE